MRVIARMDSMKGIARLEEIDGRDMACVDELNKVVRARMSIGLLIECSKHCTGQNAADNVR
jgi:hypothetical protein